jgi:hypothetical protein
MPRIEAPGSAPISQPPPAIPGSAPAPAAPVEPFSKVLTSLGHELERGEAAMRQATLAARFGQDLSPAQAISLQAAVYRYNEAVDLSSKLVDRFSNGLKTVVGQGQ